MFYLITGSSAAGKSAVLKELIKNPDYTVKDEDALIYEGIDCNVQYKNRLLEEVSEYNNTEKVCLYVCQRPFAEIICLPNATKQMNGDSCIIYVILQKLSPQILFLK